MVDSPDGTRLSEPAALSERDSGAPRDESPRREGERARLDAAERDRQRRENRRWWIRLFAQPLLLLVTAALLLAGLGTAQRFGFLAAVGSEGSSAHGESAAESRYICPMMCTPAQGEPGRCPVCAMELVPASSGAGGAGATAVEIDPAARRVADIRTVEARWMPVTRTIRAVGELHYDESRRKTIAAYVSGRLERLYADYTGVSVRRGEPLALLYSPGLYSAQVELLAARQARSQTRDATLAAVAEASDKLYASARQRLVELGMTPAQIDDLERSGEASSRIERTAPISGTVIQMLAAEGDYVREGQPIYRLADLSSVWLMLHLFPEEAALVREGQKVEAEVQSLPGRAFPGRVTFVDPNVESATRTVKVRVVMPNPEGQLRVGDYARATIQLPVNAKGEALVVPREALLAVGRHSVIYVETEPGRFELRRVTTGPTCGEVVVVLDGLEAGERVATRGNFLIDSQMQLVGNPSLIDPTRARPSNEPAPSAEVRAALAELAPAERSLARDQEICPVTGMPLGSMGVPPKVDIEGRVVFLCCEGCRGSLLKTPAKYLAQLDDRSSTSGGRAEEPAERSIGPHVLDLPPIADPVPIGDPVPVGAMERAELPLNVPSFDTSPPPIESLGTLPPIEQPREIVEPSRGGPSSGDPLSAETSRERAAGKNGLPREVTR